jgi:hypothetical protein
VQLKRRRCQWMVGASRSMPEISREGPCVAQYQELKNGG